MNYIRFAGIFLFIATLILPLSLPFNQKVVLSTALVMAIFWATETIPIPITSLFPLIIFPLFGIESSEKIAKSYMDPIIFLFLGGFIIAISIEKWNLHYRIAIKILNFFKGNLLLTLLGLCISTAFISMWISNTASTMMMLPIVLSIIKLLEEKSNINKNFSKALLLSIAYSSSIGGIGTLIGSPPNLIFASFYSRNFPENPVTFFKWFLFGFPFLLILIPILWLILIIYSGGFKKFKWSILELKDYLIEENKKIGAVKVQERLIILIFLFLCILWIFRAEISFGRLKIYGWGNLFKHSSFFHDSFSAIFCATLLFFIKIEKKPILEWREVEKKVPWGILILFGGGLSLADLFIKSGLSKSIANSFKSFQVLPFPVFLFLICFLMVILTEFTSNTAITATMLPVIFSILPENINPVIVLMPATISASLAFMLPVATPPNAIVFSSGNLKIKEMLKIGFIFDIICLFILTFLSLTYLKLIF